LLRNFFGDFQDYCYLAPEKILAKGLKDQIGFKKIEDSNIIEDLKIMDIFSLGCVISEVILNGKITFNYELLLKYKKEEETINEILD